MRSAASGASPSVVPIGSARVETSGPLHAEVIARTKLRPPRLRERMLERSALTDTLSATVASLPVTLLIAPAGFGKTMAMAVLARRLGTTAAAWVSLDEDDADRWRFLAAVTEALRAAEPSCVAAARALLAEPVGPPPNPHRLLDLISNDLLATRTEPLALFLDDLHLVGDGSLEDLAYLVEHAPPTLHFVLAARLEPRLPIARWRARGVAAELRPGELGFSAEETARFVNGVLDLRIAPDEVERLHEHTRGWPAALTLVAEALGHGPAAAARSAVAGLSSAIDQSVFDFLSHEVIDGLDRNVQDFLLQVAVLDELTPACCAAVSGRPDAGALLADLQRHSLFVVALDGSQPVLRLHDLFRSVLLRRFERESPDRFRDAHRRAATAVATPEAEVRHLLAAEDWDAAADAIARRGPELMRRGLGRTVCGWIESLPSDVTAARPKLDLLLGTEAWARWDLHRARTHLARAERAFARAGDTSNRGRALVFLSHAVHTAGQTEQARAMMDAALECQLDAATRMRLHVQEAWYALSTGRAGSVVGHLDAALDLAETAPDASVVFNLADTIHCHFVGIPGVIDRFERFGRLAAPYLGGGATPLKASVLRLMAWAHQWRGRTAEAEAAASEALAISDRLGDLPCVVLDSGVGHATCMATAGRHDEAEAYLGRISELLRRPELVPFAEAWLSVYLAAIGRVRLLQGRIDEARRILEEMEASRGPKEWPAAPVARTLMAARLALAERRWADAEAALSAAAALQQSMRLFGYCDDARLLLARLLLDLGRPTAALEALEPALAEAIADGTPGGVTWHGRQALVPVLRLAWQQGMHRDLVSTLLADLGDERAVPPVGALRVPTTGESITERELEVLSLISRGHSNAAIAEQLFLSVHTVKRHVANLLRKLDCRSRTAAFATARELGLLEILTPQHFRLFEDAPRGNGTRGWMSEVES